MDNPKSSNSPPPPATTTTTISGGGNKKAMENLKSLVMKCAMASSTPTKPQLTPPQKTFIENRIQQLVPTINTTTPDHPSYALMIENAIKELNEEGRGSSEDAISNFILKKYNNNNNKKNNKLGWAHSALLKHHLVNLCESGNLVITSPDQGFYALTTGGISSHSSHSRRSSSPSTSSTTSSTSCSESDDPTFTLTAVKLGRRKKNNIKSNQKSTQSRRKSTNKFKGGRIIK